MIKNNKKVSKIIKEEKKSEDILLNNENKINSNKKNNDKFIIITIFVILAIIVIIFSLRYFLKEKPNVPETKIYNGFTFVKIGNYWQTTLRTESSSGIKEYEILFHFTPDQVENISTEKNIKNQTITPYLFMNTQRIYITTNPEYPSSVVIGGVEISKIIGQVFRREVRGALTKEYYNNSNAPIITCEDINDTQRVIYLKLGNETKIYSDDGCIIVQGENPEMLLKASERLAFEILKIL
ncbi:MAG: hypothetical protein QXE31_06495 [Candidatus Woesearchaeota archaeon]